VSANPSPNPHQRVGWTGAGTSERVAADEAIRRLARSLAETDGVGPTIDQVVAHALSAVPCQWAVAAVTDASNARPPRFYSTSDPDLLDVVTQISVAAPSSPGRQALTRKTIVHVPDMARESRFGSYPAEMLARTPIRSALALVLQLGDEVLGVLTLYGSTANSFDEADRARAALLADFAAIAVETGLARDLAGHLQVALGTSRIIGTAMGVLVERHRLTPEQAFEVLRTTSQNTNRKLADVARELTRTGELPDAPPRRT
jgi:transcriptional regulator with GAF, ATPase, and Fis domain